MKKYNKRFNMNVCYVPYTYSPKVRIVNNLARIYVRFYSWEIDVCCNPSNSLTLNEIITTIANGENVWVDIMLYNQYSNSHEIIVNDCLTNGKDRIRLVSNLLREARIVLNIKE